MDVGTQLIVALVPGLIIAIVTAFVTVRLSLRQFYSERWWERKAEAYSTIIESLYHVKNYADDMREAEETGRDISKERHKELEGYSKKAYGEINKATAIGAFIISNEAVNCLRHLRQDLQGLQNQELSFYNYLDSEVALLDKCLAKVRECAKKDLKVE